jgi:hypothetical protein
MSYLLFYKLAIFFKTNLLCLSFRKKDTKETFAYEIIAIVLLFSHMNFTADSTILSQQRFGIPAFVHVSK